MPHGHASCEQSALMASVLGRGGPVRRGPHHHWTCHSAWQSLTRGESARVTSLGVASWEHVGCLLTLTPKPLQGDDSAYAVGVQWFGEWCGCSIFCLKRPTPLPLPRGLQGVRITPFCSDAFIQQWKCLSRKHEALGRKTHGSKAPTFHPSPAGESVKLPPWFHLHRGNAMGLHGVCREQEPLGCLPALVVSQAWTPLSVSSTAYLPHCQHSPSSNRCSTSNLF